MNILESMQRLLKKIKETPGGIQLLTEFFDDEQSGTGLMSLALIRLNKNKFSTTRHRLIPTLASIEAEPRLIARLIDHTQLKPEATPAHIIQLCQEAQKYDFASVCVNPAYVDLAVAQLRDYHIPVCSVVGFPLGNVTTEMKVLETQIALVHGAREIDMVIHVGQLKAGNEEYVLQDMTAVVNAASPRASVKVILETCLLTEEEIIKGCQLAQKAGAHFVKTSTGFSTAGATAEQVKLMRNTVGDSMGVKAAGGIRDFETALSMLRAGANRIGASASVAIVEGAKKV